MLIEHVGRYISSFSQEVIFFLGLFIKSHIHTKFEGHTHIKATIWQYCLLFLYTRQNLNNVKPKTAYFSGGNHYT